MVNPFAQFSETNAGPVSNGGSARGQTSDSSGGAAVNPFQSFNTGTELDEQEQDVVGRTRSQDVETPDSFGLVDIPKDVGKGFAQRLFSTPQILGASLVEQGELEAQRLEEGLAPSEKTRRQAEVEEFQVFSGRFPGDFSIQIPDTSEARPEDVQGIIKAGNDLIAKNQDALRSMNLIPEGEPSLAFKAGDALATMTVGIGATMITKSPALAAGYMGALVNSQDYMEARRAGKAPDEAAQIAASSAAAQSALEAIGGRVFLNAARNSSFVKKVLVRTAGQSAEEGSQTVAELTIKNTTGVRDEEMSEIMAQIGEAAMIGAIVGAPVTTLATSLERKGQELGLDENTSKEIATNLVQNKGELIDAATALVAKETTGLGTDEAVVSESKRRVKEVIREREAQIETDRQAALATAIDDVARTQVFEDVDPDVAIDIAERMRLGAQLTDAEAAIAQRILTEAEGRTAEVVDGAEALLATRDPQTLTNTKGSSIASLESEILLNRGNPERQSTLNSIRNRLTVAAENNATPTTVARIQELIDRAPLGQLTDGELSALDVRTSAEFAKGAKTLAERRKDPTFQKTMDALVEDSVPLSATDSQRAPIGEKVSTTVGVQNRYTKAKNTIKGIGIATNPMDVFFDMLDGVQNYTGANYRTFKATVDRAFSKYLNLKEKTTRDVKNLSDELGFKEENFDKIGAWAVLQQEGGQDKMLDSGFTQEELDVLTLTEGETRMYNLMRQRLDSLFTPVQNIMQDVYGKNVVGVKDYFPFLTDHSKLEGSEIQDQLGDDLPTVAESQKEPEKGFTIERTLGEQAVRIDAMGVFLRHIDNAAYLIEMAADLKKLGTLASAPEYRGAVGDMGQDMVIEWLNLISRKGKNQNPVRFLDGLRRNIGAATLGFKLSTIFVQPTALADGAALIGGQRVAQGVRDITRRDWRQFVWDNLPEVRERAGDDPSYLDLGGDGKLAKAREAGFFALKFVDSLVASSVAIGAYRKSVEERGGVVDLNNPDPVAVEDAQRIVRRTQASGLAKDAPAIISLGKFTGNESVDRIIFQFQSFMLNRWSLIKHDLIAAGIKGGQTKQAANIAMWLTVATFAEIGLRQVGKQIEALATGDEPEPLDETLGEKAVQSALSQVPFVSQAVSAFEYGSTPVPAVSISTNFFDKLGAIARTKSVDKKKQRTAEALILGAGVLAGVPGAMQAESLLRKSSKGKKKKEFKF